MTAALEYTEELVEKIVTSCFDEDAWRARGRQLAKDDSARQWELGDWLNTGVEKLTRRKAYTQALNIFQGYTRPALRNLAYVARNVQPSLRNDSLSWAHHCAVARFKPEGQRQLLDAAAKNGWSLKQLRNFINKNSPATASKPKLEKISVPFAHSDLLYIRMWAKTAGLTEAEFIHQIVEEYFKQNGY
jgi:hypothetical protein